MPKSVNELNKNFAEMQKNVKVVIEYIDKELKQNINAINCIINWINEKFGEVPKGITMIPNPKLNKTNPAPFKKEMP